MSAPQPLQPSYLGKADPANRPEPPSAFDMLKYQVMADEYREGNLKILRATAMFALGIVFVRSGWGSALVPVF